MKEKTRHQRSTSKRSQEYRDLLEEVEELRASERNLRVRVKSLTNELAVYKRDRVRTSRPQLETGATHLEIDQGRLQGRDLYLETDHGPVTACQRERGLCLEIALPQESDPPQPIIAVSVTDRRLPIQIVTTTNQGVGHHHLQEQEIPGLIPQHTSKIKKERKRRLQ